MKPLRPARLLLAVVALLLCAGALRLAGPALAQTGGGYDLTWWTVDGGGSTSTSGGGYALGGTIGQPDPGQLSGGSYTLVGGFWSEGGSPTAVRLIGFWIEARSDALVVRWETATELDALGFHLYRSDTGGPDSFVRLNDELIPSQAPGSPSGASYEWVDAGVETGQIYYYLLEDVDVYGQATRHGPVSAMLRPSALYQVYLPLLNR